MSGPMVRAIIEGRKTQTRRIVKGVNRETEMAPDFTSNFPQHGMDRVGYENGHAVFEYQTRVADTGEYRVRCPYGQPGDRLWVRETWMPRALDLPISSIMRPRYRADESEDAPRWRGLWKPSIHMPRWASRLTLEITGIRVERLQAISDADKETEGATADRPFGTVWRTINTKPGTRWDDNPWVWVIEFRRAEPWHTGGTAPVLAKADQCSIRAVEKGTAVNAENRPQVVSAQ